MQGATSALYEPLIERDLGGIAEAARAFAAEQAPDRAMEELWLAVTRFAVLAYSPSQHGKRTVMACRAVHPFRSFEWIVECARYAAESRQPWSEPPILDPPPVDPAVPASLDELREAMAAKDRLRGERWLAARLDDCVGDLRAVANGDALLMLDTVLALDPLLGEKGRFALYRLVIHELMLDLDTITEPVETLIDRAIDSNGAVDDVRAVLIASSTPALPPTANRQPPTPYRLARDYANTLLAHAADIRNRREDFLAAVHHNLAHGESFAEWSFA